MTVSYHPSVAVAEALVYVTASSPSYQLSHKVVIGSSDRRYSHSSLVFSLATIGIPAPRARPVVVPFSFPLDLSAPAKTKSATVSIQKDKKREVDPDALFEANFDDQVFEDSSRAAAVGVVYGSAVRWATATERHCVYIVCKHRAYFVMRQVLLHAYALLNAKVGYASDFIRDLIASPLPHDGTTSSVWATDVIRKSKEASGTAASGNNSPVVSASSSSNSLASSQNSLSPSSSSTSIRNSSGRSALQRNMQHPPGFLYCATLNRPALLAPHAFLSIPFSRMAPEDLMCVIATLCLENTLVVVSAPLPQIGLIAETVLAIEQCLSPFDVSRTVHPVVSAMLARTLPSDICGIVGVPDTVYSTCVAIQPSKRAVGQIVNIRIDSGKVEGIEHLRRSALVMFSSLLKDVSAQMRQARKTLRSETVQASVFRFWTHVLGPYRHCIDWTSRRISVDRLIQYHGQHSVEAQNIANSYSTASGGSPAQQHPFSMLLKKLCKTHMWATWESRVIDGAFKYPFSVPPHSSIDLLASKSFPQFYEIAAPLEDDEAKSGPSTKEKVEKKWEDMKSTLKAKASKWMDRFKGSSAQSLNDEGEGDASSGSPQSAPAGFVEHMMFRGKAWGVFYGSHSLFSLFHKECDSSGRNLLDPNTLSKPLEKSSRVSSVPANFSVPNFFAYVSSVEDADDADDEGMEQVMEEAQPIATSSLLSFDDDSNPHLAQSTSCSSSLSVNSISGSVSSNMFDEILGTGAPKPKEKDRSNILLDL
eukprot:ANDGO_08077.mRNA.1 hypothetical protein